MDPKNFAMFATGQLKTPITENNVTAAARVVKVDFKVNHARSSALRSLHQLRSGMQLLAAEVVQLKGELGQVCSPTILELAKPLSA